MNEKGMSLVSVMIAAGLMGIIAVFMMKMQENQLKTQNDMMARSEIANFMSTLTNTMAKPGYCEQSLKGEKVSPESEVSLNTVFTPNKKVLFQVGENYGQGSFKLLSVNQKSFTYDDEDKRSGLLTFDVAIEKRKKSFGAKVLHRELMVMVQLDDGEIVDCGTLGSVGSGAAPNVDTKTIHNVVKGVESKEQGEASVKEEEVKEIIENNENLKMMQEAIRSMKETNAQFKDLEKQYLKEDANP